MLMIAVTFCVYPWWKDRAIAARQQTASGTIVAHEPANHDRYGYTFNVNQKTYSGWQVPHDDDQFTVGQVVTVHYDPQDPNNSALENFSELADQELGPVPLLIAAIPLVALIEFLRRRGKPKSTRAISG
jgi:flavin-dependent dehydrogenase